VKFAVEKMEGRKLQEIGVALQPEANPEGDEPEHRR